MELLFCFKVLFFVFQRLIPPGESKWKVFLLNGGGGCCCLLNIQTTPYCQSHALFERKGAWPKVGGSVSSRETRKYKRDASSSSKLIYHISWADGGTCVSIFQHEAFHLWVSSENHQQAGKTHSVPPTDTPGAHWIDVKNCAEDWPSHFPTSRSPNLRWRSAGGRGSTTAWRPCGCCCWRTRTTR